MDYGAPGLVAEIDSYTVPERCLTLWWLGQASFVLKAGKTIIYIDPYLQQSAARLTPSPFPPEAVTNASVVVVTHDHLDHIDPLALPGIAAASPRARFVAPRPLVRRVEELVGAGRVQGAVVDEPLKIDDLEILPVPAKHEEFYQTEEGYPYLGYTLRLPGIVVHHTGDTIPYEGQVERVRDHAVDVLLAPINGRDFYRTRAGTIGNTDYREVAEFAAQIRAKLVIPMHYGMFRGNTVPPGHLVSYLADVYPEIAVHVMGRYGRFTFCA